MKAVLGEGVGGRGAEVRKCFRVWKFCFFRDVSLPFYSRFYGGYNSIYSGPGYFFFRAKEGPTFFNKIISGKNI